MLPGKNNEAKAREGSQAAAGEKDTGKKKELDKIAAQTLRRVIDNIDNKLELDKLDSFQMKQFNEQIYDTLVAYLEEANQFLSQGDKQKVIQYVSDEIFGYGPITPLLKDPDVTEIMVNGYANVYAERDGRLSKTGITFRDDNHVLHAINKIITPLGRRIDESSPTVDARLPDGSRVNAIIPPLALRGPSITIRKFSADPFTVTDLVELGTMSKEISLFLAACVRARVNIVVSGGTGSGKTTTLNVLSSFIPDKERIVTIEDTAELQLQQDNLVTLESRPANIEGKGQFTIRELVTNSLRMRPDRIIIGEVRGGEALDMLQAMNTGHDGSISTLHANSPQDALARLETMVLMAGMELPLRAIREQIGSAMELVVQQSRFNDGSRKITKISEVAGMKKDRLVIEDIFVFDQTSIDDEGRITGEHRTMGIVPRCLEKLRACGESIATDDSIDWGRLEESLHPAEEALEEETEAEEMEKAVLEPESTELHDAVAGDLALKVDDPAPEKIAAMMDHQEKRIGFLAEIHSGRNYESGNPIIGAVEELQPTANLVQEVALIDPARLAGLQEVVVKEAAGVTRNDEEAVEEVYEDAEAAGEDVAPLKEEDDHVEKEESAPVEKEESYGAFVQIDDTIPSAAAVGKERLPSAVQAKDAVDAVDEKTGRRSLAASIPPGQRGIALRVNESGGLCSFLHAGDRVDLLIIYKNTADHEQQAARTVAQDVLLLDIRENSGKSSTTKNTDLFSVFLAITPSQAEMLVYASLQGDFYLILCPTADSYTTKVVEQK